MLESIRSLLHSQTGEAHRDRTAGFVLEVLSKAEESENQSLAALEPDLMTILRDDDRPPWVTGRALDAYIHIAPPSEQSAQALVALLEAIQDGVMPDPDEGMRVALLEHLYPDAIGPEEVWRCALPRHVHNSIGSLSSFWHLHVLPTYSDQQVAALLDSLCEDAQHLVPALANSYLDDLPVQLLARGLRAFGDTLETERLFGWLDVAGGTHRARRRKEDDARFVRSWLESRPHVQKAVFLAWLRRQVARESDRPLRHWPCDALHRSKLPGDFGLWCLDQATALEDSESSVAQELVGQAYVALADPSLREGLSLNPPTR